MRKVLVVGKTGVGKSSFINSVFGRSIAATSEFEPCTRLVSHYAYATALGDIELIDTPGLGEDTVADDEVYLRALKSALGSSRVHTTLYVTRLCETRFYPIEKRTLRLLTQWLGAEIWRDSWLVLTWAATLQNDRRDEATQKRRETVECYLRDLAGAKFEGFSRCIRIDNQVQGWSNTATPASTLFDK